MASPQSPIVLTPIDGMLLPIYVRLILAFRHSSVVDSGNVMNILRKALSFTAIEYPALGGSVVQRNGDKDGRLEVRNFEEVQLIEKQLPDFLSYDELDKKRMSMSLSMSLLPDDALCPVGPMAGPDAKAAATQANFIPGGILLCVCLHHKVFDGVGGANIFKTWSHYCNVLSSNSNYIPQERLVSPQSRDTLRLMNKEPFQKEVSKPLGLFVPPDDPDPGAFEMPKVQMVVKVFRLTQEAQTRLKASLVSKAPNGAIVSSNDAICALAWATVSAARRTHLEPDITSQESSTLGLAVNGRSRMTPPLPQEYPYNLGIYGVVPQPLQTLYSSTLEDLVQVALAIRSTVDEIDDSYIRNYVAYLDDLPDVSKVQPSWNAFLGKDYTMTSWATNGLYEIDWGATIGGKAEYVRLPTGPFDGVCIILPRRLDGSLELIVGLREDDMERILNNERFMSFAEVFAE